MNKWLYHQVVGGLGVILGLTGCSVKQEVTNHYKLASFSNQQLVSHADRFSILVNDPEAVAGYQTQQMLYMDEHFKLSPFAHSDWVDAPASMLFPLILQSLQRSGYFYVVSSTPGTEKTDYRLDTQLIALQQNFLTKPSQIELTVKAVLTHMNDDRIIASRLISEHVQCVADTPYGGVVAANKATTLLTTHLNEFVIDAVKKDNSATSKTIVQ